MPEYYPALPWRAEASHRDVEGYRVVRGKDGRPVAYVERRFSEHRQEDIARLIARAPVILEGLREVFFASADSVDWSPEEWKRWREKVGPSLADLWPVERK